MLHRLLIVIAAVLLSTVTYAQSQFVEEFGNSKFSSWSEIGKSKISPSNDHFRAGEQALRWSFKSDASISWSGDIDYKESKESGSGVALSTFSLWIFNNRAIDDSLKISFYKDGDLKCYFYWNLNFTGWRSGWIAYARDMVGTPVENMDQIIFTAPSSSKGELLFDQMVTAAWCDPRHHHPDLLLPEVNSGAMSNVNKHWLGTKWFFNWAKEAHEKIESSTLISEDVLKTVSSRIDSDHIIDRKVDLDNWVKYHRSLDLKYDGDYTYGAPVAYSSYRRIYFNFERDKYYMDQLGTPLKDYASKMLNLAVDYRNCEDQKQREQLGDIFIDLFKNLQYYGWEEGSGLGSIHHVGYSFRNISPALFLMRDLLKDNQLLDDAQKLIYWVVGTGRIYQNLDSMVGLNVDVMNTFSQGMLISILMESDREIASNDLRQFKKWIDKGVDYAPGLRAPFKVDGSFFHHYNHYTLYGRDALEGFTPVIHFISGTEFDLTSRAKSLVKKVLINMDFYTNNQYFPIALSGRHPKGTAGVAASPYYYMAKSYNSDGELVWDRELASIFISLTEKDKRSKQKRSELLNAGLKRSDYPSGSLAMNYACAGFQRRDDWLVAVKGFNRYLWGAEIYNTPGQNKGANLYGRYMSYGQIEVQYDSSKREIYRGFSQKGWNWNRFPGTTTINLPLDKLEGDVKQVDNMSGYEEVLFSEETYGGALAAFDNSVFGMKLHEHAKYNGSHKALKSIFIFDDRVIALGSAIENDDDQHSTETTLFQNCDNGEKIESGESWVIDNLGTGYYTTADLVILDQLQKSRDQSTTKPTEGRFLSAYIDHGKAPKGEAYEYAMVLNADKTRMDKLASSMASSNPEYRVIQKDSFAHIVSDLATSSVGYSIFDSSKSIDCGVIASVDTPLLLMSKSSSESNISLAVTNPDLSLYKGIDKNQYVDGNYVERSIYSREWASNESIPTEVRVILKGEWKVKSDIDFKVKKENSETTIIFNTQHSLTVLFQLTKQ